jgi:hypothetical protein
MTLGRSAPRTVGKQRSWLDRQMLMEISRGAECLGSPGGKKIGLDKTEAYIFMATISVRRGSTWWGADRVTC